MSIPSRALSSTPSPAERRLIATIAANTRHARLDADQRRDATAAARKAVDAMFDDQVPAHIQGADREAAVARIRSAHMSRLALASARARRRNRAAREAAEAAAMQSEDSTL